MTAKEKLVIAKSFVLVLNGAFRADPRAISALLCNRVPCNGALAAHPTVQVQLNPTLRDGSCTVGLLGVINGICETVTGQRVASKWKGKELTGFCLYEPPSKKGGKKQ